MNTMNTPLSFQSVPSPGFADPELAPLLAEPLASVWAVPAVDGRTAHSMHERLQGRIAAARQAEVGMLTVHRRRAARQTLASGVSVQPLYRAPRPDALRPGEPLRAMLVELAPGARFDAEKACFDSTGLHREWLVVAGEARHDGQQLSQRDYRVLPAGCAGAPWVTETGALLFLRESAPPRCGDGRPFTVFDAQAGWHDFGPGIRRRVLWQQDGQAALLYAAEAGARVPAHSHGHDEECLMVQGELFLDDRLLQAGDYQIARAGTGHRVTETDTGVVIYAHGDLDLQFTA